MSGEIDPLIQGKLLAFRSRFRGLTLLRGVGRGVLLFLFVLMAVAAADYFVLMEDSTRYTLSGLVYLAGLLAAWFLCVRPMLRALDETAVASLMEEQAPELRHKLLSAVELAGEGDGSDSEALRQRAREQVKEDLRGLQPQRLMPPQLVKTCTIAALAAGILLATVGGLAAASTPVRTLLMRALAPMANIERVSRNQITILYPTAGNTNVPENDTLQLRVSVAGPELEEPPLLQTELVGPEDVEATQVFMDAAGDGSGEFVADIAMGRMALRYRVRAGDAITKWFTLQSVPRPFVEAFTKTFTFPDYTQREPATVREEGGSITALTGTDVDLTIHLDQSVAKARLHLVTATATNEVDFTATDNAREWTVPLTVRESGSFTVHVETASGLDNKFRPEYALTAQPDLVPTLKLTQPKGSLTARPEDIVPVAGEAGDDIGLEKIEQLIKVNDKAWITNAVPLAAAPGTNTTFQLAWDLLKLDAKPGDTVITKFTAVDLKGSRAESSPVRLKVDSAIFEADRIAALDRQRLWSTNLATAADLTLKFHEALPADIESFLLPGSDAERREKTGEALKALGAAKGSWSKVRQVLPAVARRAHAGREVAGMGLLGRVAVRMETDWLARARLHLDPLEGIVVDPRARLHAEQLPELIKESKVAAEALQTTANGWLAADEAALAVDLMDYIVRAASHMHSLAEKEADTDSKVWERLARRQTSVAKELEVVLATLQPLAARLPDAEGAAIQTLRAKLITAQETFDEASQGAPAPGRLPAGRALARAVAEAAGDLRSRAHRLADDAAQARVDLEKTVGPTATAVTRLQEALKARQTAEKKYEEAKEKSEGILKANMGRKVAGEILTEQWKITADLLRGRARLEETGKASNALFVSDTASAAAAIDAVHAGHEAGRDVREVTAQLKGIAEAISTLEAAHELTVLETAVKALAARERWERQSTDANTLRPRDWQWLRQRMAVTPERLRAAGLSGAGELEDAADSKAADTVAAEMKQRQQAPGTFPVEKKPKKK